MIKDTIAEQLVYSTVKLTCYNSNLISNGTAFFMQMIYDEKNVTALVTNKHVVTSDEQHTCFFEQADLILTKADNNRNPIDTDHITLHIDNLKQRCVFHPTTSIDLCLVFINVGIGLVLSALFVFFRDIQYLYRLFTQIVMYGSAIFYNINSLPQHIQNAFYCNPIFVVICYFRSVVINNTIPELWLHGLLAFYAVSLFSLGCLVYKKYNYKFLYYV